MPRSPRLFLEGGAYHVYCRVTRREPVFEDAVLAERFVETIREVKRSDGFTVFAWCVMPNHYHLALRTRHVPLWQSMKLIQGRFAQWHNRRLRVIGPFWQGRYKAKLLDDQQYLDQVIAYIHLNPVRAGLDVDYRWSGHRELVGRVKAPLTDVDDALLSFGEERRAAVASYRATIEAMAKGEWVDAPLKTLPWWRKLGKDQPLEPTVGGPYVDQLGRSTGPERPEMDAAEFVERVCELLGVHRAVVVSLTREREIVRCRDLLSALAVERYGIRTRDLAAEVSRTPDQISRAVGRARVRRVGDAEFGRQMEELDRALVRVAGAE